MSLQTLPLELMIAAQGTGAGTAASDLAESVQVQSVWDFLVNGGLMMIPIGLCSVVAVAYTAPVVLLPRLLGESSDLVIAASTLAGAAVFNPARRRIQTAVDHRFDRARYDGEREVDAFTGRLRGEVDLGTVTEDLSGVLGRTIAPVTSSIWLRDGR